MPSIPAEQVGERDQRGEDGVGQTGNSSVGRVSSALDGEPVLGGPVVLPLGRCPAQLARPWSRPGCPSTVRRQLDHVVEGEAGAARGQSAVGLFTKARP
jgi:hypothetical protein